MNDDFEKKLCDGAERGLKNRFSELPSVKAMDAVRDAGRRYARRIRFRRAFMRLSGVLVPVAACLAVVFLTMDTPNVKTSPGDVSGKKFNAMAALVAFTTMVVDFDSSEVADLDVVLTDVEAPSDVKSFADSVVLMQESACVLDDALAVY